MLVDLFVDLQHLDSQSISAHRYRIQCQKVYIWCTIQCNNSQVCLSQVYGGTAIAYSPVAGNPVTAYSSTACTGQGTSGVYCEQDAAGNNVYSVASDKLGYNANIDNNVHSLYACPAGC